MSSHPLCLSNLLFSECSLTSSLLGVDAGKRQVFPELLQQVIQVQLHATAAKHQEHLHVYCCCDLEIQKNNVKHLIKV